MNERTYPISMAASADGWRGRLGQGFSPCNVALLADCIFERLAPTGIDRALIGHDGRAGGAEAAHLVASALARHCPAATVQWAPHLPTPVASDILASGDAQIAVLVTASHNPADWNGIKVKLAPGAPIAGADEQAINAAYRSAEMPGDPAATFGPAAPVAAAALAETDRLVDRYVERLLDRIRPGAIAPLRVVVDGLGGIAGAPAARLCERLGHDVVALGAHPEPDFGGLKPDPTVAGSRARAARAVVETRADIGFVLDGDGDRVIALDASGTAIQSQELMAALLCRSDPRMRTQLGGDAVVTTACGRMVRAAAAQRGMRIVEAPVGFKHISRFLRESPCGVGVGSVGDLGFSAFTNDRDPTATMILVSAMLAHAAEPLDRIVAGLRREFALEHLQWAELHAAVAPGAPSLEGFADRIAGTLAWRDAAPAWTVDGLRVEGPRQQWYLLRESTTEGGRRLYGEFTREALDLLPAMFVAPEPAVAPVAKGDAR